MHSAPLAAASDWWDCRQWCKLWSGYLGRSWLRVVVEKPFGKDLCSSEALAEDIAKYYPEEQVRCWRLHIELCREHPAPLI